MPLHTGTLRTSQTKHGRSESEAFEEIGHDVWTGAIAEALEILEIVRLRAVSIVFKKMMSDDDLWLNRLTLLALRQPSLSDLEKGAQETAYAWYQRCCTAVDDGTALALRHKQGVFPYLELYGTVDGTSFAPFAELRFPMPRGFIAELITLKGKAGCRDPPYDALLCFPSAPLGCDWSFRLIFKEVKEATRTATAAHLRKLPEVLARPFAPAPRAGAASSSVDADAPAPPERRVLDALQRRLGHVCRAFVGCAYCTYNLKARLKKVRETATGRGFSSQNDQRASLRDRDQKAKR